MILVNLHMAMPLDTYWILDKRLTGELYNKISSKFSLDIRGVFHAVEELEWRH